MLTRLTISSRCVLSGNRQEPVFPIQLLKVFCIMADLAVEESATVQANLRSCATAEDSE